MRIEIVLRGDGPVPSMARWAEAVEGLIGDADLEVIGIGLIASNEPPPGGWLTPNQWQAEQREKKADYFRHYNVTSLGDHKYKVIGKDDFPKPDEDDENGEAK